MKEGKPFFALLLPIALFLFSVSGCGDRQKENKLMESAGIMSDTRRKPRVPEWHRNATIYEVNLRHYTPEGTLGAFEAHLPRLKTMGVDILWLMPIFPASRKNRKGPLGSPYAVADYRSVNPDFGNMEDFKHLIKTLHEMGMYCIIDWVPNHTGWDHNWITEHPEWFTKDADGKITDPINSKTGEPWGWTDVADLNFGNREMRQAMIEAMAFWIKETGIDGFRVDVAHGIPVDFWVQCTEALYAIKPLFMLSEGAVPEIVNNGSFVMDYAWEIHQVLNGIARSEGVAEVQGKVLVKGNLLSAEEVGEHFNALDIDRQLALQKQHYEQGYKMQFTSNHDENAWAGTEFQRFGKGHKTFAVLTATFDGMPLIYSGQESAVDKQYNFFDKDEIPWGDYAYAGFYKTLFDLKHNNRALWNGEQGGALVKISTGQDEAVYAFMREKDKDRVVVLLNLSASDQEISLEGAHFAGSYTNVFNRKDIELTANMELELNPWEYLVFSNKRIDK